MTRKRFIKLVMSQGYQRNKANRIADAVMWVGFPYESFWEYASASPAFAFGLYSYI